jgi:quercetin dioxygenase-like cupin family protein
MFTKNQEINVQELMEGVKCKSLAYGDKTSLHEFVLEKGAVIPEHQHPHEQTGYLISGHMLFFIGGERFEAQAGDGWNIPGKVSHRVEVLEESVVLEVFAPVREDYFP